MAQRPLSMHESGTHEIDDFCKARVMADTQRTQIIKDEEDEDQLDEYDETESEDEVDEPVVEDMQKLEENFKGISRKYRLINRIGEGD
jgi:hypothetical protein